VPDLFKQILALSRGLSEIQLRKLAEDEKVKAAGLLTDEACLHLVANNLGLEVEEGKLKKKLPPVESAAPLKSELEKDGIDFTKVDYLKYGTVIKGKGYLESEVWGQYNKVLAAAGYKYSKEERAWTFQSQGASQEQGKPQGTAPAKDKTSKVVRISDLSVAVKNPTIEGQLLDDPIQRDVNTKKGPASVTSFRLDDGTAIARVSVWGELGNKALSFVSGDKMRLTSLMVKEPFDGMIQVNTGNWSEITKI
jgi:hypothetical protein